MKRTPIIPEQTIQQQEQEEKDINNVTEFKPTLLMGGKEPPTFGGGDNWLSGLETGTMFLIQDKQNPMDFNLGMFLLKEKTDKAVILATPTVPHPIYVNPVRFCNKYTHYETLGVFNGEGIGDETEETTVDTDVTSDIDQGHKE